ncbi:MAG: 16S rRNA (cytosine(967)-C(5))-methyltransferase RsmB [Desulfobacterales bacterium]|nr:16S rRNA (cytosine(967)-C(5))-methyltransferase RsmB [Desulfobacterales bacterium]
MAPDIRKEALTILSELEKERPVTLDRLMDTYRASDPGRHQRDKAFLQALVFGILRSRNRLDWTIRHFSKTPFRKISPDVKNLLRLGIYQILYMDRVPDSATVNTAVELAKKIAAPWTVKFVNGLLRNVARNPNAVTLPDIAKTPVHALSVHKSLPKWLVQRWLTRFDQDPCVQLCDAVNTIPPLSLRTNTLNTTRAALLKSLDNIVDSAVPTAHAPEGILLQGLQSDLQTVPGFKEGSFQVQDEGAQLVSHLLAVRPGQRVLDACAGLGGKTGHIAQLIENNGIIVAMDSVENKLTALQKEMHRLGISIVTPARHDLTVPPDPAEFGTFDRVLLDAPCSGLGVLRRNPDTRWQRTEADLKRFAHRQQKFLNHLAPLVKPGGILVYAVCSMEPEENEAVVRPFLARNRLFEQIEVAADTVNDLSSVVGSDNCLRTFPHRHNMDGFFAVCLKRLK